MSREKTIKQYMEHLGISKEEATQLWEDDQEDYIGEEGEKMQEKAKENCKRYESSTKKRKPRTVERKVDTEKLAILELCAGILEENGVICTIEKEICVHFNLNDTEYSLKLTKHRPPKK